jgi:type I restriction-modification system DNA methylase subunit
LSKTADCLHPRARGPCPASGCFLRGGAEERIRTKLLGDGHIDTVISIPEGMLGKHLLPTAG